MDNTTTITQGLDLAYQIKSSFVSFKSAQDYKGFIERFKSYLADTNQQNKLLTEFSRPDALRYLDWLLIHKKINTCTRNNYLTVLKNMFFVLLEREYIKTNPFVGIKKLREPQKLRTTFPPKEIVTIMSHVKATDDRLLLAICLCYYCAIRPAELRRLKIKNIQLDKGMIIFSGDYTKNRKAAFITIPTVLIELLETYHLTSFAPEWYLFGTRTLYPNPKQCGRDTISKRHKKMMLNLKKYDFLTDIKGKTFYAWKDTAAEQFIKNGFNILDLKNHLRHEDIKTTQRYLEAYQGQNDRIKNFDTKIF